MSRYRHLLLLAASIAGVIAFAGGCAQKMSQAELNFRAAIRLLLLTGETKENHYSEK